MYFQEMSAVLSSQLQQPTGNQGPNVTYFHVSISGEIQSAQGLSSSSNLFSEFQFVAGQDWQLTRGEISGCTQSSSSSLAHPVVFNFPISTSFKTSNPSGWPRLVVTIYEKRGNTKSVLGYGSVLVPPHPGRHIRDVLLSAPESSSLLSQFFGWVSGRPAQLITGNFMAQSEGRDVLRMQSLEGKIRVNFNVSLKDHKIFDFSFN